MRWVGKYVNPCQLYLLTSDLMQYYSWSDKTCVRVVQPPLMLEARGVSSLRSYNIQISLAAMTVMCGNVSETVMTPLMIYMYMFRWVESCLIGRKPLKPWPWEPGAYITTQSWRQTASCPLFNRYNAIKKNKEYIQCFQGYQVQK